MIVDLDHLNIRTAQLAEMVAWYGRVLDMHPGPRADFDFPGAWLYANDRAYVHLVEVAAAPAAPGTGGLSLEHGAFRATGIAAFAARLDALGERSEVVKVPGMPVVQVNIWDPDGNHLHIDFDAGEPGVDALIA